MDIKLLKQFEEPRILDFRILGSDEKYEFIMRTDLQASILEKSKHNLRYC